MIFWPYHLFALPAKSYLYPLNKRGEVGKVKIISGKTISLSFLLIVAVLSIKAFYFGFYYYEDARPDGKYKIVVSSVPSLLDLQAVPPGDSADKYVWVRLYAEDGTKLNETFTLLNSLSDKVWADDAVFITSDLVWRLPENK